MKPLEIAQASTRSNAVVPDAAFHLIAVQAQDTSNVSIAVVMVESGNLACLSKIDLTEGTDSPLLFKNFRSDLCYLGLLELPWVRSHPV